MVAIHVYFPFSFRKGRGEGIDWTPCDSEAYYSMFCDYGMTDAKTGKLSPHRRVGYQEADGSLSMRMPDNIVDIVREGINRYTGRRHKESGMVNDAIVNFANKMVEQGKIDAADPERILKGLGGGDEPGGGTRFNVRDENVPEKELDKSVEKGKLQNKVLGWLTEENLDWAEGKEPAEVFEHFGNDPEPIAIMPDIVRKNIPTVGDDYLYCGKGYLIDHQANHHPELGHEEYINLQTILDSYDDIKDLSTGDNIKIAFVKKLDKGYAVVAELSKENDKIVLHKTFFYKDSAGKRIPYKNKPSILEKWSVDGSATISPVEKQQPADTENISALDHLSVGKGTTNIPNDQTSGAENGTRLRVREESVDEARRRLDDPNANEFERQAARAVLNAAGDVRFNFRDELDTLTGDARNKAEAGRQMRDAVTDFVQSMTDTDELSDKKFASALRAVMRGQRNHDRESVKAMTDMARAMVDNGMLSGLSDFEVKQAMTAIKDATGRDDIGKQVNRLADIMLSNMTRRAKGAFEKLLKNKGMRQDSRGVVVQGGLDLKGQRVVRAANEGIGMPDAQSVQDRMADVQGRLLSNDPVVRAEAEAEMEGLLVAERYHDTITRLATDREAIKNALEQGKNDHADGNLSDEAYRQLRESCEAANCLRTDFVVLYVLGISLPGLQAGCW